METTFLRITEHVCQRCGMCCQGRGDFAFDLDDAGGEYEPDDCTALCFEGNMAVCRMQDNKRDCCLEYPADELCEREMKEAGLWKDFERTWHG